MSRVNYLEQALAQCDLVFTYGTLKAGEYNSHRLTSHDAECLGRDTTVDKYVMGDVGFPYVFERGSVDHLIGDEYFKPVVGCLWRIPSVDCFRSLDALEGYPHHYNRRTEVLSSGYTAWMYFQEKDTALGYCRLVHSTDLPEWEWS